MCLLNDVADPKTPQSTERLWNSALLILDLLLYFPCTAKGIKCKRCIIESAEDNQSSDVHSTKHAPYEFDLAFPWKRVSVFSLCLLRVVVLVVRGLVGSGLQVTTQVPWGPSEAGSAVWFGL